MEIGEFGNILIIFQASNLRHSLSAVNIWPSLIGSNFLTLLCASGYGNLAPSSSLGRMLMILYALIGIPMNGIMLATLAEFFSTAVSWLM
jgi:hypothetical protein